MLLSARASCLPNRNLAADLAIQIEPWTYYWCSRLASTPPFSECSKFSNSVRASNLASNCSERLWLHARTILVAMENYSSWPGESNPELAWRRSPNVRFLNVRFLFCLRLSQNANTTLSLQFPSNVVPVETYDVDEDHTLQKQSSCSQACGFATITMYSWWQLGEIGCAYRI